MTVDVALELLAEVGATLVWAPEEVVGVAAIEVYPAATLAALGLARPGYKEDLELRERIMAELPDVIVPEELRAACVASSDALDAVLAVVAGVHFLEGRGYRPVGDGEVVRREGWIWVVDPRAGRRVSIGGTPIAGEDARERAWKDRIVAAVGTRAPCASVALDFTVGQRRTVDLDNLCRPAMAALREAGAFGRGFANLRCLVARKAFGTPEGLEVGFDATEGVLPGVPELVVDLPELPPTGPELRDWMRVTTALVAAGWTAAPVEGPVFVDIVVAEGAGRSLVDVLKPLLDTLQPYLGRSAGAFLEFTPCDEKVVWLRVRRAGVVSRMMVGKGCDRLSRRSM